MRRSLFAVGLVMTLSIATPLSGRAQATPTAAGCAVEPRSEAELAALLATPTAALPPAEPIAFPEGVPVDAATLAQIEGVLSQIEVCTAAGELARLLALYTDAYVVRVALAPEPVPIEPALSGSPVGVEPAGTPVAKAPAVVEQAVTTPDGQIVALVSQDGRVPTVVTFKEEAGQLRIDGVAPLAGETPATPEAALPAAVEAARAQAAADLGVPLDQVEVVSYEATQWMDTSLGCPKPGKFYAQVLTPGYNVTLRVAGQELTYHTDKESHAVACP